MAIRSRVALVTCVWQRRALTRAFWTWAVWLRQYWAASHQIALDLVAAVSDPLDRDLALSFGVRVVEHPNQPLGKKFNAALGAVQDTRNEWVMVMGSDDLFCERVANALGDKIVTGQSVGLEDLYFHDLQRDRTRYYPGYQNKARKGEPVGPGTLHPRELLEVVDWKLWDDTKHKGMDHSRFKVLRDLEVMPPLLNVRDLGGVAIDIKSGVNLWAWSQCGKPGNELSEQERDDMWAKLPAHVVARIPFPEPVPA